MISVEEAERIILKNVKNFGVESISFENILGRVLAEDIKADRDLPPFNRSTMDGIAISFSAIERDIQSFKIINTQAAGEKPVEIKNNSECVEIMTGAALPASTDTIIPYENLKILNDTANLNGAFIIKGQNIHLKGKDKNKDDVVAVANQIITPSVIGVAASMGYSEVIVKKLPRVVIISTGDELVEVNKTPSEFQIRRSNNYMIRSVLQKCSLTPHMLHLKDDLEETKNTLGKCLDNYDVIILSGGISMGKFDYVNDALKSLSVDKLFHKVQQRPGKPFWFGCYKNKVSVFAFPGNPVSTFMCLHRYFLLWLQASLGVTAEENYAVLNKDFSFKPNLKYFLQVQLKNENGKIMATPVEGNGSGDFANLLNTQAFMELPAERNNFTKGEVFKIFLYK